MTACQPVGCFTLPAALMHTQAHLLAVPPAPPPTCPPLATTNFQLPPPQEERLRELFAEHGGTGRADRFDLIAEGLEGELGRLLTAAQVGQACLGWGWVAARGVLRGRLEAGLGRLC